MSQSPGLSVLVCGAGGYLGRPIALRLQASGFRVFPNASDHARIPLANPELLAPRLDGIDLVLNLVTPNEVASETQFDKSMAEAPGQLHNLCTAAIKAGVRHFVQVSTAQVYGDALIGELDETTKILPNRPYAYVHQACEAVVLDHRPSFASLSILRLSNVLGPPSMTSKHRWKLFANHCCLQAALRQNIQIRSKVNALRNIVNLEDVLDAIVFVVSQPQQFGPIINISGNRCWPLASFAEHVAARAQQVLQRPVSVVLPSEFSPSPTAPFDLRRTELASRGFAFKDDIDGEITRCLTAVLAAEKGSLDELL